MKRLITIIIISGLLHCYIGLELLVEYPPNIQLIGALLLFISWIIIPIGVTARFIIKQQQIADLLAWMGMICMGLLSSVLILTFLRQILFMIYGLFYSISTSIAQISAILVIIFAIIISIIGLINARKSPQITKIEIPLKNLPPELEGFTIAQISDIHVGPTIKYNYLKNIVNKVNALNPHMVAITGDLVDGSVAQLSQHTIALQDLKSLHGSFFVLGNHEYYSGADEWITELNRIGLSVLLNEHKVISHNNTDLIIAGVTDFSGEHFGLHHKSDPAQAINGAPENTIKILLAHQPRSAIKATKHNYDLQLSGHTHGGQFWPWNLFVRLQQPYTSGLNKLGEMWVYTNRGTGYWGPPKRLGSNSEITLIKIIAGNKL